VRGREKGKKGENRGHVPLLLRKRKSTGDRSVRERKDGVKWGDFRALRKKRNKI